MALFYPHDTDALDFRIWVPKMVRKGNPPRLPDFGLAKYYNWSFSIWVILYIHILYSIYILFDENIYISCVAIENGNWQWKRHMCIIGKSHFVWINMCVCAFDVVHLWRIVSFQHSCDMHEFEEKLQGSNQSNQIQQKNC